MPKRRFELADEVRDEGIGGAFIDLARARHLLDAAAIHHRDAVGEDQGLLLIVGDEERGDGEPLLQAPHLELHRLAQLAIERAKGLVEEEEARIEHDRARERHALLLTARELARQPRLEPGEADELERLLHPPLDLAVREPAHLKGKGDVLARRHVGEEGVILEHHAHVALGGRGEGEVLPAEPDRARFGQLEAGHHLEKRGLARAARAENGQKLPRLDAEIDAVECLNRPEGLADARERETGRGVAARHRGEACARRAAGARPRQGASARLDAGLIS